MYAQNHNPLNFPSMHKPMCVEEMAGYDLTYTYQDSTGHKFQLANVRDINYRTEETPSGSENVNNNHAYEYDTNNVYKTFKIEILLFTRIVLSIGSSKMNCNLRRGQLN